MIGDENPIDKEAAETTTATQEDIQNTEAENAVHSFLTSIEERKGAKHNHTSLTLQCTEKYRRPLMILPHDLPP